MTSDLIYKALFRHFSDAWMQLQNSYVLGWESDFLCWVDKFYWCEVEVKVSRADFKRDFSHKPKKHQALHTAFRTGKSIVYSGKEYTHYHDWPGKNYITVPATMLIPMHIPHRFYFACPEHMIQPSELPKHYGLIWVDANGRTKLVKRPKTLHAHRLEVMEQVATKQHFMIAEMRRTIEDQRYQLTKYQTTQNIMDKSTESFEAWLNRIAEIKPWKPSELEEPIDIYVSRIDGGYLTFSNLTQDLRWLYEAGITEEIQKKRPDGNTCCIGFNPTGQKWFGWSHRACFGFGIGSQVKEGDSGYDPQRGPWKAETLEDAKQMAIEFAESVG